MSASLWQSGDKITRSDGSRCVLDKQLGFGNDGVVFTVVETPDIAVKLYAEVPDDIHRIVRVLRTSLNDHLLVLAPYGLVFSADGDVAGFAMLRLGDDDWQSLESMVEGQLAVSLAKRIKIAQQLATRLVEIHEAGLIIGDLSGRNVRVDLDRQTVAVIDVDSFGWVPRADDPGRRPSSVTVHNRAPRQPDDAGPDANDDNFTLASHVIHLLLGVHPFTGVPKNGTAEQDPSRQAMIDSGLSWLLSRDSVQLAPAFRSHPGLAALPAEISELATLAFGEGAFNPQQRPSAEQWRSELTAAASLIEECAANSSHQRFSGARCWECARSGRTLYVPPAAPLKQPVVSRKTKTVPARQWTRSNKPDVALWQSLAGAVAIVALLIGLKIFFADDPLPKAAGDLGDAQQALLQKLSSETFTVCKSPSAPNPSTTVATLSCAATEPGTKGLALVMQFTDLAALNAYFSKHDKALTATGACANGDVFLGTWSAGGTQMGRLVCYKTGGLFRIEWSTAETKVAMIAQGEDAAALYRWWESS